MIALKEQPYPTTGLDSSIFEEDSADYGDRPQAVFPDFASARSPCHVLLTLVQNRQFEDARRVRDEFIEMGVPIQKEFIYRKAAAAALRSQPHSPERVTEFLKWWSLYPDASYKTHAAPNLAALIYAVTSNTPVPDLPLIMHFAVSAAEKGLISRVELGTIPLVIRYTPPSVSLDFMYELAQTDRRAAKVLTRKEKADVWSRRWASRYGLAIRAQCAAGRPEAGLELYESARKQGIQIGTRAQELSKVVGRPLATDPDPQTPDLRPPKPSQDIQSSPKDDSQDIQSSPEDDSQDIQSSPEDYSPESVDHIERIPDFSEDIEEASSTLYHSMPRALLPTGDLVETLRFLKSSLRSRYPPPASVLENFIGQCVALGRSSTLAALRKVAHKSLFNHSMSIWALAEMNHLSKRSEPREMYATFCRYFFSVGVPSQTIKFQDKWVKDLKHRGFPSRAIQKSMQDERRLRKVLPANYRVMHKLPPSSHHTALVWREALKETKTRDGLEALYQDLVSQVRLSRNIPPRPDPNSPPPPTDSIPKTTYTIEDYSTPSSSPSEYPKPIPVPIQWDAFHFDIFIREFGKKGGPTRSVAVIEDMYELGITPSLKSMTNLASALAWAGDMPQLEKLLTRMEKSSHLVRDNKLPKPALRGKNGKSRIPPPNIVTYNTIMRFLANKRKWEDAATIAKRLFEIGRYVRGENEVTDKLLAEIEVEVPSVASFGVTPNTHTHQE